MSKLDIALKVLKFTAEKVVDGVLALTDPANDIASQDRSDRSFDDVDENGLPLSDYELTPEQHLMRVRKMDYLLDD